MGARTFVAQVRPDLGLAVEIDDEFVGDGLEERGFLQPGQRRDLLVLFQVREVPRVPPGRVASQPTPSVSSVFMHSSAAAFWSNAATTRS